MSKAYHSQFGGPAYRGEMAPFSTSNKTDGNDNPSSKVKPYEIEIKFGNDGDFYARATILRHDYNWRALTVSALRIQIKQTFPDVRFQFFLSRAAELATNPAAAAMLGRDR